MVGRIESFVYLVCLVSALSTSDYDVFCNMSQTSYQMPKLPDEFEMNVEIPMYRNKSGYNARDYMDTKEKYSR